MAIDTSIITDGVRMQQAIQQNNMNQLQNLGGNLGQIVLGRRINQMRQITNPEEQQAFANKSIFSPFLNDTLRADKAAAAKAAADQLKFDADLNKTYAETYKIGSESGKIGAETGKINTETGITRQNNTGSIWSAFLTGGPVAAKAQLENMKNNGVLNEASYQSELNALNNLPTLGDASKQQEYAMGRFKGTIAPEYVVQTQNNIADNATSRANNKNTVDGQKYIADQNYDLGVKKIEQDDKELSFEKSKISPIYTMGQDLLKGGGKLETIGGVTYVVMNGDTSKGVPYVDKDGKPLSATPQKNGAPKLSDNALKQVNELNVQLSQANQSYKKIGQLVLDLRNGNLDLSAANVAAAKARIAAGISTPNDLAIDRFQSALNQAANDVLMMAKGTQTEGDAQRAVATITANPPRDNAAALQALNALAGIQRNTRNTINQNLNTIYDNYGIPRPGANNQSQNRSATPPANTDGSSLSYFK